MTDDLANDARVLWIEDVLRYCDMDPNGHVNNTIFSVLAESGRVSLFRAKVTPTLDPGTQFVIARLAIDFVAELSYPGRIRTGTWLSRLGRSSLTVEQVILTEDGRLAGRTEGVCVLMDRKSRRSTPFSDTTRNAVEAILKPSGGSPRP